MQNMCLTSLIFAIKYYQFSNYTQLRYSHCQNIKCSSIEKQIYYLNNLNREVGGQVILSLNEWSKFIKIKHNLRQQVLISGLVYKFPNSLSEFVEIHSKVTELKANKQEHLCSLGNFLVTNIQYKNLLNKLFA